MESDENRCDTTPREYNIGLRVGLLFAILATSAIGVFGPILLHRWMPTKLNLIFIVLKQFGTGIIISTAFVHVSFSDVAFLFKTENPVADLQPTHTALHTRFSDVRK